MKRDATASTPIPEQTRLEFLAEFARRMVFCPPSLRRASKRTTFTPFFMAHFSVKPTENFPRN